MSGERENDPLKLSPHKPGGLLRLCLGVGLCLGLGALAYPVLQNSPAEPANQSPLDLSQVVSTSLCVDHMLIITVDGRNVPGLTLDRFLRAIVLNRKGKEVGGTNIPSSEDGVVNLSPSFKVYLPNADSSTTTPDFDLIVEPEDLAATGLHTTLVSITADSVPLIDYVNRPYEHEQVGLLQTVCALSDRSRK